MTLSSSARFLFNLFQVGPLDPYFDMVFGIPGKVGEGGGEMLGPDSTQAIGKGGFGQAEYLEGAGAVVDIPFPLPFKAGENRLAKQMLQFPGNPRKKKKSLFPGI